MIHNVAAALLTCAAATCILLLGAWGFNAVTDDLQKRAREIESQRELSLSADYQAET